MNSIVAGAVPIAGTLLGAALTYALWARSAAGPGFALRQQLWQERLVTYSSFAGAMTEARLSQKDRWHLGQGDPAARRSLPPRRRCSFGFYAAGRFSSTNAFMSECG
jgi:hypothetical protein